MVCCRKSQLRHCLAAAVLFVTLNGTVSAQDASTIVAVRLRHAHQPVGRVDVATDDEALVLRHAFGGVVVRTRIPWTSITEVVMNNATISIDELKRQLPSLMSQGPPSAFAFISSTATSDSASTRKSPAEAPYQGRPVIVLASATSESLSRTTITGRPRSLQLATQPANWDSDAEVDGLLVAVRPVDEFGRLIPVNGQLSLKLYGLAATQGGQSQRTSSPFEFPVVEETSLVIRREDFTPEGAVYRLEFRRFSPERDPAIDAVGLLNGRLVVPGIGTFAASESITWLRPYSPLRDMHQMFEGRRSLPREMTP